MAEFEPIQVFFRFWKSLLRQLYCHNCTAIPVVNVVTYFLMGHPRPLFVYFRFSTNKHYN